MYIADETFNGEKLVEVALNTPETDLQWWWLWPPLVNLVKIYADPFRLNNDINFREIYLEGKGMTLLRLIVDLHKYV